MGDPKGRRRTRTGAGLSRRHEFALPFDAGTRRVSYRSPEGPGESAGHAADAHPEKLGARRSVGRKTMNRRRLLNLGAAGLALCLVGDAGAEEPRMPYVRMAELEIDPAHLEG